MCHSAGASGPGKNGEKYNEVYFQFFSHGLMALLKIGKACRELRPKIHAALRQAVETDDYILRITHKEPGSHEYAMAENLRSVVECELKKWEKDF